MTKYELHSGTDHAQLPLPEPSDVSQAAAVDFDDLQHELNRLHTSLEGLYWLDYFNDMKLSGMNTKNVSKICSWPKTKSEMKKRKWKLNKVQKQQRYIKMQTTTCRLKIYVFDHNLQWWFCFRLFFVRLSFRSLTLELSQFLSVPRQITVMHSLDCLHFMYIDENLQKGIIS